MDASQVRITSRPSQKSMIDANLSHINSNRAKNSSILQQSLKNLALKQKCPSSASIDKPLASVRSKQLPARNVVTSLGKKLSVSNILLSKHKLSPREITSSNSVRKTPTHNTCSSYFKKSSSPTAVLTTGVSVTVTSARTAPKQKYKPLKLAKSTSPHRECKLSLN